MRLEAARMRWQMLADDYAVRRRGVLSVRSVMQIASLDRGRHDDAGVCVVFAGPMPDVLLLQDPCVSRL